MYTAYTVTSVLQTIYRDHCKVQCTHWPLFCTVYTVTSVLYREDETDRFQLYLDKSFNKTASLMAYSCKGGGETAGSLDQNTVYCLLSLFVQSYSKYLSVRIFFFSFQENLNKIQALYSNFYLSPF